ncbi:MAG TPA: YihY/virulence factor BrkB family protein [Actinomycetota bacterium]|jgi:YihY family inner membrane protein|nr:YihY/virulence factor BrkB family protein [Actinomycetota bacterium]
MVASASRVVNGAQRLLAGMDRSQQRRKVLAVPFAVVRKFGDDQAGNLAALLAYYGFFSLFPLLLVLVTALDFVLAGHIDLQEKILDSALAQFPVIGDRLREDIGSVQGSGLALALGLAATVWAGLGITQQAQAAMNTVWGVPRRRWPSLWLRLVRGFAALGVVGVGVLATTLLSGLGTVAGLPVIGRALPFAGSLAINLALFAFAFVVLTALPLPWRRLLPGAVVAAVGWSLLQALGGYYVTHQLKSASQVYGTLAFVIVLLSWLYLGAQLFLYAAELNVVLAKRLWPRSLLPPPLIETDKRALTDLAKTAELRPEVQVEVDFTAPDQPSRGGG